MGSVTQGCFFSGKKLCGNFSGKKLEKYGKIWKKMEKYGKNWKKITVGLKHPRKDNRKKKTHTERCPDIIHSRKFILKLENI
jgi:hypothetical protein